MTTISAGADPETTAQAATGLRSEVRNEPKVIQTRTCGRCHTKVNAGLFDRHVTVTCPKLPTRRT